MANVENKDLNKEAKKRFVKALYSYVPVNNDELQLKVHDILEVIEETEEGWWKGILEGNVGMFPSNFVVELDGYPEDLNNKLMNELSLTKNITKGKNAVQQEPMHRHGNNIRANKENAKQSIMDSAVGNEIDGTSSSKCPPDLPLDKKIITPCKKPSVDSSAPRLPPKPVREQAQALFPYEAQNEDELTLKEGDIITVISKEVEDKGWWRGELNNKIGVFPDNFVKLIKADEQKKPERPDKPSSVVSSKSSIKSTSSEKGSFEPSPKIDKKVMKTPPAKPPPPELHKKDPERPLPPCPSKKPQPPHPVKKPARISVKSKHQEFSSSTPLAVPALKSPISETSPPPPLSSTYPPPSSEKTNTSTKSVTNVQDKKEKDIKAELEFDALETSSKKLVHLTANRAKAPNRRPPSLLFLKDNEKDVDVTVTDSRRRSEPLLNEMESLFPDVIKESTKSATLNIGKKPKVPPPRPFLPSSVKISSTIKNNSIAITRGCSSFEEVTVKGTEGDKKDLLSDSIPADVAPVLKKEIIPQKATEVICDVISKVDLEEPLESKDAINASATVTWKDFNDLLKQVNDLKGALEAYRNNSNKAISDLKVELEEEKKLRRTIEIELEKLKGSQTT